MQLHTTLVPLHGGSSAVALGFFDGVHIGHQAVISRAVQLRESGLTPCVFTFTAGRDRPRSKRESPGILSEAYKLECLERLGVEAVYMPPFDTFKELDAEAFVRDVLHGALHAACVCCGEDFRFSKGAAAGTAELRTLCARYGVQVRIVPPVLDGGKPVSSTRIRALIRDGDVIAANRLLGRPFCYDFEVVKGRQLGRTMNFPTINQYFPDGFVIPRYGVYAAFARVDGVLRKAVTNIGVKPTVGSDRPLSETFIFDYSGDLYGKRIRVYLMELLRGEKKFAGIEELKRHIAADSERAQTLLDKAARPELL